MAALSYEILTDPVPFRTSGSDDAQTSVAGTVYIVVSNPTTDWVPWYQIEVVLPCGKEAGDLTDRPDVIKTGIEPYAVRFGDVPKDEWDASTRTFTVSAALGGLFTPGDSMVLSLDGFPVSDKEGLVRLTVNEISGGDPGDAVRTRPLTLSLLKRAPKAPRNFRPEEALVDGGENVVLVWDGPDTLTYTIEGPDGLSVPVPQRSGPDWRWSPGPDDAPLRDVTYTLVATSPDGRQPGCFLTTTVAVRRPEFEAVTAVQGLFAPRIEGTTDKGVIVLTEDGVEVLAADGAPGLVSAGKADVEGVTTRWVRGRDAAAGWIEFPAAGLNVFRGEGDRKWGTVAADKADLNGINTAWVQGRDAAAGWIEFPAAGVNVFRGEGDRQWGTVAADKADLNDLATDRARVKDRLTLDGGLTVTDVLETRSGPSRLIVHGRLDAEGELSAAQNASVGGELSVNGELRASQGAEVAGTVVASDLTVRGKLRTNHEQFKLIVEGESLFRGQANANGGLAVRNEHAGWLVHAKGEQVSIQGDLRVHGAFRSDS
ncbi:hypothetical protein EES41_37575 (plasmid) [Streptomyces sp. ADI95-16]|uniref:hypothetical protein n=1 Tax=Streptomyces sp. ADI95-16 TaxID=1522758 RepID=UPI000F3A91E4|nr:hypothetical protein [Streptomyces sp. ADI95-16]AYV32476.1 hypothetical protein EES41_37575 [Streptomyces sp. ADI95-16]